MLFNITMLKKFLPTRLGKLNTTHAMQRVFVQQSILRLSSKEGVWSNSKTTR